MDKKIEKEEKTNEKIEKKVQNNEKPKKKKRIWVVLTVLALAFLIGYIVLRATYLEVKEIGQDYLGIFWQNCNYTAITFVINFLFLFIVFYFTNRKILKGLKLFFDDEKKKMPKLPNKSLSFIIALIGSMVTSKLILNTVLLCFSGSQFGISDPVFNLDIGYFLFQRPLIIFILIYLAVILVASIVYAVIYYIVILNMYFDGVSRETVKKCNILGQVSSRIKMLAVLLGLIVVMIMVQDIGKQKFINLKDDSSGYSIYGAGMADVTIKLWGYVALAVIVPVTILMALKALKNGNTKRVIGSVLIVPIYLIGLAVVLALFQVIVVDTNEYDKEKKYISSNIEFTKNAYGLNIEEVSLQDSGTITQQAIVDNADVLNNIAIVSPTNVLQDLENSQKGKGYYSYRTTQLEKYNLDGKDKLVYITPREIDSKNSTYNNKTYEYTHGYGTIVTSASQVDEAGNITNIQKDFGDTTSEPIAISQPRIYFGLETNDTVVTNGKNKKEFDYPNLNSADVSNAENVYDGEAGLNVNFLDRIILGIKQGDIKLAFSGEVTKDSKILTNRNIINRAKTIMPYLTYDKSPYLVVDDNGKLIWVLDAYTTSNNYPYSQKIFVDIEGTNTQINYIRNSVKVLIDAYDGTTKFYITDRNDPIVMAYSRMYPNLFQDKDEVIPADVSSHFVYPKYLYDIQRQIIERYHNVQPDVLYRSDDVWDVATHNEGRTFTKTGTDMDSYYTMVKTVEKDSEELGLVIPYTPYGKQNIISYLVGTYENGETPKLTLYKYPNDSNVLGPMQLDTQIEQDTTISSEIASLNVSGTKISKNMIIVPIDNTLLYVEPIYQQSINEALEEQKPTLKRVVVASGNKVAIGNDLKDALKNLVSQYAVDIEVDNTDNLQDLIDTIIKTNKNLENSTENNDWEMFGKDMKKLQELIDKLDVLVEKTKKEEAENLINSTDQNTIANDIGENSVVQ